MLELQVDGDALRALRESGCALLSPAGLTQRCATSLAELNDLRASWDRLPPDAYLRDGGRYRSRRHSCFVQDFAAPGLQQTPHRAHWQPLDYNALHGGIERWFDPIEPGTLVAPAWNALLRGLGELFADVRGARRWHIEAHQFRIDTLAGIGRPTPEGAHRDGVDFLAVILVQRRAVRGGESRIFEADGPAGVRFTMLEAWTALLIDDARVIHETTPIQQDGAEGVRDTLVVTYRERGFQAPE